MTDDIRTRLILEGEADEAIDALEDVGEAAEDLADDVGDAADSIPDKFRDAFSGLGAKVNEQVAAGVAGVSGIMAGTFQEGAKLAINVMGDAVKGGLVDLGVDPDLAGNLQRFAEGMGDMISGPVVNRVSEGIANIGVGLAEKIATSGIGAALSGAMGALGTAAGAVMNLAIAAAPLLLPALLIAGIVAAIALVINDPSIPEKVLGIGRSIVGAIIDGLVSLPGMIIGFLSDLFTNLWEKGAEIVSAIGDFAGKIPEMLVNGLASLALEYVKFIAGVWRGLWDAGITIVQAIGEFAGNIPGAIVNGLTTLGQGLIDFIAGVFRGLWEAGAAIVEAVAGFAGDLIDGIIDGMAGLGEALLKLIGDAFAELPAFVIKLAVDTSAITQFLPFIGPAAQALTLSNPPNRAHGGPVSAMASYVVGERGPELFVPQVPGTIVPNHELGGGRGTTNVYMNLSVTGNPDPEAWSARAVQALDRRLRRERVI